MERRRAEHKSSSSESLRFWNSRSTDTDPGVDFIKNELAATRTFLDQEMRMLQPDFRDRAPLGPLLLTVYSAALDADETT